MISSDNTLLALTDSPPFQGKVRLLSAGRDWFSCVRACGHSGWYPDCDCPGRNNSLQFPLEIIVGIILMMSIYCIEISTRTARAIRAARVGAITSQLSMIGIPFQALQEVHLKIIDLYFLAGILTSEDLQTIAQSLICDPVTESYRWHEIGKDRVVAFKDSFPTPNEKKIEVALRPNVTDNVANELLRAAHRLGITGLQGVATGTRYAFNGNLTEADLHHIARQLLVNETIHRYTLDETQSASLGLEIHPSAKVHPPDLIVLDDLDEADLLALSAKRRLALDGKEMGVIQDYFIELDRPATDAELETIAQTWSEHCVHKTFKASIKITDNQLPITDTIHSLPNNIDSLIKTYLQSATQAISAPWVRSAFVDNAGVIAFDDEYDLSFKVETHNHPSAIEPFGGANTGVGGVVRDILGVSHRPIANTDVLCFGPMDTPSEDLPPGVLHPARIRAGVVAGIEDYGNKLGLPTVNGAIFYHPGYTANPLVYCGCVGLGPRDAHPHYPQPGDRIIVLGGRTGRDGLRGATFSSLTMDAQTGEVAGASVQIGDPITEKGLIEVITRARDARLYNAITDCGAGGLSSAVGEMSNEIGAKVDLSLVPLKYAGLEPWEIWLSEAQERMVLAVPPENLPALAEIFDAYWVTWCDIGEFTNSGRLKVTHGDIPVVNLDNHFLHKGLPRLELEAVISNQSSVKSQYASRLTYHALRPPVTNNQLLTTLLSHPNIASKEEIIRVYDHEVRGATVVRSLVGVHADGPSDAAVIKPLESKGWRGFVLANGINPLLGEADPYVMAVSAVDEAVRNAVAVGADPSHIAILDNFCWGDPRRPEILGNLVRAAQGCHDAALHYGTPLISGKDSLNNEFVGIDGKRHAIPGTLLISSIGIHPDVRRAVTMDLKSSGNRIYLVGDWEPALGGSHALALAGSNHFGDTTAVTTTPGLPDRGPQVYYTLHNLMKAGLIRTAHDLSEGGLAVAAAEMALAGRLGLQLDLTALHKEPKLALFAETNGCLLVEVAGDNLAAFEDNYNDLPFIHIGHVGDVNASKRFNVVHGGKTVIDLSIHELVRAVAPQQRMVRTSEDKPT